MLLLFNNPNKASGFRETAQTVAKIMRWDAIYKKCCTGKSTRFSCHGTIRLNQKSQI